MMNFTLTGKVNSVTLDSAFKWLIMPFKRLSETSAAMLISCLFIGICLSVFYLCSLITSLSILLVLFLPFIIGSVLINFHSSYRMSSYRPSFYVSLHQPFFSPLMRVALVFFGVTVICVLLLVLAYVQSGLYSDEISRIIKQFLQLLSSERSNEMFTGNLADLSSRLSTSPEVIEKIVKGLVLVFSIGLIMVSCLIPWLFLCCCFAVFSYDDARKNRINFFYLIFTAFFKFRNWMAYFLYGFTLFLLEQSYSFFAAFIESFAMGNLYVALILAGFIKAPVIVYASCSYYFMFIDLFCDTTFKDACSSGTGVDDRSELADVQVKV